MPSRTPGDQPDPAVELLGRWQAHHSGTVGTSTDDEAPEEPVAEPPPTHADRTPVDDVATPDEPPVLEPAEPVEPDVEPPPAVVGPAPKHAAPRATPGQRRTPAARGADQTEAGREVVEALGITPPEPAPPAPAAATPISAVQARRTREPARPGGATTDVEFAPRVVLRRILGWTLLLLLPVTAGAGYLAYERRETLPMGIAGTLVVLVLVVYAVRVGSVPAHLAIHSGQLEVVRGNTREVFDLTSRFTRLEVVGKPGRPGWKVLMARFGRDPLVIDSSMVDPAKFTAALERHRPQSR